MMTIDVNKESAIQFEIENKILVKYVFLIIVLDKKTEYFFDGFFDPKTRLVTIKFPKLKDIIPIKNKTAKIYLQIYGSNRRVYQIEKGEISFYFNENVSYLEPIPSEEELKVNDVKRKVTIGLNKDNLEINQVSIREH